MTHTALARKYRPTRFADLVGQEHVAAGLAGAVARNRVAHAYLLTGPRGVGKTSAARILAMALNCERQAAATEPDRAGEPCGECDSCRRIWAGSANLDVVEIDAASNRGVDDARDLRERAMYAASGPTRHKVYIIDEAHMLTREAWNALLKILEEPPPGVVFVFATTEPQKIANAAAPVLSRLQRFDFRRIGPQAIAERLRFVAVQEQLPFEEDAVQLLARVAAGGMRDALSLLDQALVFGEGRVTATGVREALGLISHEMYQEMLDIVAARDAARVFPFVARLVESGADLAEFVNGAGEVVRALLLRVLGGSADDLPEGLRAAVDRHAGRYSDGDLLRMLRLLAEVEGAIRRSPNVRLHVELLLAQWALLDRTVDLAEVIDWLKGGDAGNDATDGSGGSVSRSGREVARPPRKTPTDGRATATAPARPSPAAAPAASVPPAESPGPRPADGGLTLERLQTVWPELLDAVARRRRMVREALAHATPVAVEGTEVVLAVSDGAVHLEGLERNRQVLVDAIAEVAGGAVSLSFRPVTQGSPKASPTDPQRLNERVDRDERLRTYRAKDPALDAAAGALDLELIE